MVSPAYPAYPSFRQSIPMVPNVHSLQESPQGPHRLQDCKNCQPTESITDSPEEADTEKAYRGKIGKQQRPASKSEKSLAEAA